MQGYGDVDFPSLYIGHLLGGSKITLLHLAGEWPAARGLARLLRARHTTDSCLAAAMSLDPDTLDWVRDSGLVPPEEAHAAGIMSLLNTPAPHPDIK